MRRARRRTSSQALALRSRIVLECATGDANTVVAQRMGVSRPTVGKWRPRYVEHRLDGLVDDPRPGWSATVTAEQVEDVVVATLESAPENATHWWRAKMAERNGLSKSTIGRVWKAFGLKPPAPTGSSCLATRCSWRRSTTSSASTSTRRSPRWCLPGGRLVDEHRFDHHRIMARSRRADPGRKSIRVSG